MVGQKVLLAAKIQWQYCKIILGSRKDDKGKSCTSNYEWRCFKNIKERISMMKLFIKYRNNFLLAIWTNGEFIYPLPGETKQTFITV